jgi:S-adenosylmethionine:tRNA ribosyltransferase-isomerase
MCEEGRKYSGTGAGAKAGNALLRLFRPLSAARCPLYRSRPMRRSDFHYDLPPELIAQHPASKRSASRLLHLDRASGELRDRRFTDLTALLKPNDLLVFNDTRVIPARVFGTKPTGGQVEILLERVIATGKVLAQVRASKALKPGGEVMLPGGVTAVCVDRHDDLFELDLGTDAEAFFLEHGRMPLPPYIEHVPEAEDAERYQTVYAAELGAVAAPTAGLHFDSPLLADLASRNVQSAFLTLHVGAGTFKNVRVDDLDTHRMHAERVRVPQAVCDAVAMAKSKGGRVVAVGTTVVRSLETAAAGGALAPYDGETRLFIRPGYGFRVVDELVTNFHLPESTLMMLVCAFGGYEKVMAAYRHAVAEQYRFFSYGDAMFVS